MRTTLNVDDDVAAQLSALARSRGRSLSRVANELMREGLRASNRPVGADPYDPPTFDTGSPSLDVTDIAEALDILDKRA